MEYFFKWKYFVSQRKLSREKAKSKKISQREKDALDRGAAAHERV